MMPNETLAWLGGAIDRKQGPIPRPPRGITRPTGRDPVQDSRCLSSGLKQVALGWAAARWAAASLYPPSPLVLVFPMHIIGKESRDNNSKLSPLFLG